MIKRLVAAFLVAFCTAPHAEPIVHTNGDAHSRVLAKMFFPDAPVLASPGADGLLVWRRLDGNKTDVAIQVALATHFLPLNTRKEDPATEHVLLATLASTRQVLMARADSGVTSLSGIKKLGKPAVVGWNSNACGALLRDLFADNGIELVYVPYKTPQEAIAAFMGGHVDYICPAAASLQQMLDNGTGKVVVDLTAHHKFSLTTSLFVSKDMPEPAQQAILKLLTRPLTAEDHAIARNNGFELSVNTGEAAMRVFRRDREAWRRAVAGQK